MNNDWLLPSPAESYVLEDPDEPNLLRNIFPWDGMPRITFDGRTVEMRPPKEIWVTDTTFRDGQLARPPYRVEEVLEIFDLLHELGGPKGIVRMTEFFLYSDRDKEAVRGCLKKDYDYPIITGWIRATKGDLDLVKEMGLSETGILVSSSDYHMFYKFNKKRSEVMKGYLEVARAAIDAEIVPRCHLEDATRADWRGFVVPFVRRLMELSKESGMPVKIRACDTMGVGVPYPNASMPRSVPKVVTTLRDVCGVPSEWMEWHGHNDMHRVHENSVTAWLYGCSALNATLLSMGERTGNSPLEAAVLDYIQLTGRTDDIDTTVITKIANYYQNVIGYNIPSSYPYTGSDFNKTRAGIHIDGLIKNPEMYTIFNTEKILHRPIEIAITDKSGLAGVVFWINQYFKLKGDKQVSKDHPGVLKVKKWIDEEYESGRTTSISDQEMVALVKEYIPEVFTKTKAQ